MAKSSRCYCRSCSSRCHCRYDDARGRDRAPGQGKNEDNKDNSRRHEDDDIKLSVMREHDDVQEGARRRWILWMHHLAGVQRVATADSRPMSDVRSMKQSLR